MITILEISEREGAEFSGYEVYFKRNIHITFFYLSKYPFINSEMKAKVRVLKKVYTIVTRNGTIAWKHRPS